MDTILGALRRSPSVHPAWSWVFTATLLLPQPASPQTPAQWVVDPDPVVVIGTVDGPEEYWLTNPLAATVLSDGSVVIQNSVDKLFEIRFYQGDGEFRRTASRWGQGPCEFKRAGLIPLPGDSVLVQGQDGRFAVFGPAGNCDRNGRSGLDDAALAYWFQGSGGRGFTFLRHSGTGFPPPGTGRSARSLIHYDFDTGERTRLADVPAPLHLVEDGILITVPFGPRGLVAAGSGLVWVADGDSDEVLGYRPPRADPAVRIRLGLTRERVGREEARRLREAYLSQLSEESARRMRAALRALELPDEMPTVDQLKVDRLGNLWVQPYEPFWAEGPQDWLVFDQAGRRIAEVSIPESLLPPCSRRLLSGCASTKGILEIGADYMLINLPGDFGTPRVVKFALRR